MFINYHVHTNVYKCISSYVCTDLRVIKYMFVRSFVENLPVNPAVNGPLFELGSDGPRLPHAMAKKQWSLIPTGFFGH